ncbi:MAG: restriction endonuclease subunit S [Akkermansiaceae bacterium]|nr:restriction endonuclease subunit S [Akkermansiaceae bacterium]
MSNLDTMEPASLGDLAFESKVRASDVPETGLRVYGVDRTDGLTPDAKYTSKDLSRYKVLRPGMFAYNPMRLNIGSIAACTDKHAVGLVSPDYVVFGCKPDALDPAFLGYAIKGPEWRQWATAAGVGSVRVRIYFRELAKMPMTVPPLADQKAIAAVLGALDDKIELNRRMNATLEAMARALFDNWIEAHANDIEESSVQQLIDDRVMLIGDGYRAKNSEFSDDGFPFVRAGNLKVDGLDLAGAEVLSARSTAAAGHKIGKVDDVAFTSKGTVGRITRVSPKTGPFVYSPQICFWRSIARDMLNPNVLYRWMSSADFTRQVTAVSTQTDMAPYVSLQDQKKMIIQLPPPNAQSEIAKQLEPIDARIAANTEQSRTLATLRDTLLPKLLSGELSMSDAMPAL